MGSLQKLLLHAIIGKRWFDTQVGEFRIATKGTEGGFGVKSGNTDNFTPSARAFEKAQIKGKENECQGRWLSLIST